MGGSAGGAAESITRPLLLCRLRKGNLTSGHSQAGRHRCACLNGLQPCPTVSLSHSFPTQPAPPTSLWPQAAAHKGTPAEEGPFLLDLAEAQLLQAAAQHAGSGGGLDLWVVVKDDPGAALGLMLELSVGLVCEQVSRPLRLPALQASLACKGCGMPCTAGPTCTKRLALRHQMRMHNCSCAGVPTHRCAQARQQEAEAALLRMLAEEEEAKERERKAKEKEKKAKWV